MSESNKFTYISHLVPAMSNVNVNFIILEKGQPRKTNQGHEVRTVKVADPTGSINIGIWNEIGEFLKPGDICRLRNGATTVHKGTLNLHCAKSSELIKTGEFFMAYSELPNLSEFSSELAQKYSNLTKKGSPDVAVVNNEDSNNEGREKDAGSGQGRKYPLPGQNPPIRAIQSARGSYDGPQGSISMPSGQGSQKQMDWQPSSQKRKLDSK